MIASGASKTVVSAARTTVHGAVTITITMSLGRAPCRLRRSARAACARSAARSRVITASDSAVPATGSSTLSATAATPAARLSRPSPDGCQSGRAHLVRGRPRWGLRPRCGHRGRDGRQQVGHVPCRLRGRAVRDPAGGGAGRGTGWRAAMAGRRGGQRAG